MNGNVFHDLVSLLKVFDVNYATDEDCRKLMDVEIGKVGGVEQAVKSILLPEFLSYKEAARKRIVDSLKIALSDPLEDFSKIFERLEFVFNEPVYDRRRFMQDLLFSLERSGKI